jgi:hypothetical protein
VTINRVKTLSSSYLGENLLLDMLSILLQGDDLGGQGVNHPTVFLPTCLKDLNLLGLPLYFPNEVIDHIGQLINLDILGVNTTIEFVNNPSYTIGSVSNEIHTLLQTIKRMVLSTINVSQ